ncbi:MAG: hypothetical protein HC915_08495 [Anaerolineae bacterium]|nr:hypothetical protein [Anaerolineae bacterium]
MLFAIVVVHAPAIYRRLNGQPSTEVRRIMGVVLPVVLMILVLIGTQSLGIGLFGRLRG